jgi:hypothetical protein
MNGLNVLKRAGCRSVKIPGLDEIFTSTNDNRVERVRAVIRENRRLTVGDVADGVGISIGSSHQIVTKKFRCVASVQYSCQIC